MIDKIDSNGLLYISKNVRKLLSLLAMPNFIIIAQYHGLASNKKSAEVNQLINLRL